MNSIGNITFINQNQNHFSQNNANKIAQDNAHETLNMNESLQNMEQKEQTISQVDIETKTQDYLKEKEQQGFESAKNKDDKSKKSNNKFFDDFDEENEECENFNEEYEEKSPLKKLDIKV